MNFETTASADYWQNEAQRLQSEVNRLTTIVTTQRLALDEQLSYIDVLGKKYVELLESEGSER